MKMTSLKDVGESVVGAAAITVSLVTPILRPWRVRWGATDEEVHRKLPGDEFASKPKWQYTHAITVHAPTGEVWPWLAQIGQERGGFYSYEWLENLLGCDIHNADRIIPEFQTLRVGDGVRLHPKMPPIPVALVEPGRYFLLRGDTRLDGAEAKQGDYFCITWGFYLDSISARITRLLTRSRFDYNPKFVNTMGYGPAITEPVSFVMERKMLLGIKRRAEAAYERRVVNQN